MRHRVKKVILNRPSDQRKSLRRSLLTSLFLHSSLKTTQAKAKVLIADAEILISSVKKYLNKKENMNAIRILRKKLFTEESCVRALKYAKASKQNSGFTQGLKIGFRKGDNAPEMQVNLLY